MANEEIILRINPIMETGDVKKAVDQIESFFKQMNLSGSMKSDVAKIFKDMRGEAETFERASKEAFKTPGEVKNFEKSGQRLSGHFEKLVSVVNRLGSEDLSKLFTIDDSKIAGMTQEVTKLQQKINNLSAAEFDKISNSIKQMHSVSKSGNIDAFLGSLKSGNFSGAENALKGLIQNLQAFKGSSDETRAGIELMLQSLESGKIDDLKGSFEMLQSSLEGSEGSIKTYAASLGQFINLFSVLSSNGDIQKTVTEVQQLESGIGQLRTERVQQLGREVTQLPPKIQKCNTEFDQMSQELSSAARRSQELNREISEVKQRATYFLSLENSIDLFRQGIQKALDTVKELDKAMTETAVVTDFSIGDMWDKLPEYTKMANELGVATQGVYEASTLYYQQGLKTEEVMALTTETLKMARIAGLECADATNLMTAALRGFNMEINEASAQRVNDVYSELAAITAADTNEIATAMTKTASIAHSANMELETTAALLAQMIETTREPAETAGTAMKTIVARFTEMKKAISDTVKVDGEEVSVNKVEDALKSAGVALRDSNGEFRKLDDVLLELASKWDTLDIMTQRYVATSAAGSRQQSRFIAMMQDYERTMELVDAAYNSAGSSSKQFEKTQESLESKLARLENAWNTFLMGIADDNIIKTIVDLLTAILNIYNKITSGLDGVAGSAVRVTTVFLGLRAAKAVIENLAYRFIDLKSNIAGATVATEGLTRAQQKLSGVQKLTQRINNKRTAGRFTTNEKLKGPTFKEAFMAGRRKTNEQLGELQQTAGLSNKVDVIEEAGKRFKKEVDIAGEGLKKDVSEAGIIEKKDAVEEGVIEKKDAVEEGVIEKKDAVEEGVIEKASTGQGPVSTPIRTKDGKSMGVAKAAQAAPVAEQAAGQVAGEVVGEVTGEVAGETIADAAKGAGKVVAKEGTEEIAEQGSKAIVKGGTQAAKQGGSALAGALGKLSGFLTNPYVLAGVAIITAVTAACIAAWEFSSLKVARGVTEAQTAALELTQAELQGVKEEISSIQESWQLILDTQEQLAGLTEGTAAWGDKLKENNDYVKQLLTLFPQLKDFLIIDPETGQLSLPENKVKEAEEELEKEKSRLEYRENYQKVVLGVLEEYTKATEEALSTDNMLTGGSVAESGYIKAMVDEYYKQGYSIDGVTRQSHGTGWTNQTKLTDQEMLEAMMSNSEFTLYMDQKVEEGAQDKYVYNEFDPYAAYKYFRDTKEAFTVSQTDMKLLAKSYYDGFTDYEERVKNAASDVYATNFNKLDWDEISNGYKGGAKGEDFGDGEGTWDEQLVEAMKEMGWELVDSTTNTFEKEINGEKVRYNVNRTGGGAPGDSVETDENGVKTYKNVSGEYIKFLYNSYKEWEGDQAEIMDDIADYLVSTPVLEKIINGDKWVNLSGQGKNNYKQTIGEKEIDFGEYIKNAAKDQYKTATEFQKNYGFNITTDDTYTNEEAFANATLAGTGGYNQKQLDFNRGIDELVKHTDDLSYGYAQLYTALSYLEDGGSFDNPATATANLGLALKDGEGWIKPTMEGALNLAKGMNDINISAEEFKGYVASVNFKSAIAGAKKLRKDLNGMSKTALNAKITLELSGDTFSAGNQFKELVAHDTWSDIDSKLSGLYNSDGDISAEDIRGLGSEFQILQQVLDAGSLSATALAEAFEDLEEGTISLTDLNNGLIETYQKLYSQQDLSLDAISRIEGQQIRKSATELGKLVTEYYDAVQDLIDRGAEGDLQIGDYMSALVGPEKWEEALHAAGGMQTQAIKALDQVFHFSSANGNMAGVWKSLISSKGGDIFDFQDGKITWDLAGISNLEELISKISDSYGITPDYARAMVGDLQTYSEEFSGDLYSINQKDALKSFIDTYGWFSEGTDGKQILNFGLTQDQWEAQAAAFGFGEDVDSFKKYITENKPVSYIGLNEEGKPVGTETEIGGVKFDNTAREFSENRVMYREQNGDGTWGNWQIGEGGLGLTKILGLPMAGRNYDNWDNKYRSVFANSDVGVSGDLSTDVARLTGDEYWYKKDGIWVSSDDINWKAPGLNLNEVSKYFSEEQQIEAFGKVLSKSNEESAQAIVSRVMELPGMQEVYETFLPDMTSEDSTIRNKAREDFKDFVTNELGFDNEMAKALITDEAITEAEKYANFVADSMYNEIGETFNALIDLLNSYEITIPVSVAIPGIAGDEENPASGEIVIGGGGASMTSIAPGKEGQGWERREIKYNFPSNNDPTGEEVYNDDPREEKEGGEGEKKEFEDPREANLDKTLKKLDRIQETLDREAALIDKLPEEIAAPLKLINMGENLATEIKRDEVERNKVEALRGQITAKEEEDEYLGKYYYYDEALQEYMYKIDEVNALKDEEREKVEESKKALDDLNDKLNETEDAVDGGKVQSLFRGLGKGVTELGEKIKHTPDLQDLVYDAIRGGKKEGFNPFAYVASALITEPVSFLNNLNTKGLIRDEEKAEEIILKIEESEFGQKLGSNAKDLISQIIGGGNTYGIAGSLVGTIGEGLSGLGDFLTFDVMEQGLDMFNQMKSMAEQAVQTIIQYVQTIVNWWINREDWLYNLLTSIEKEVQNFNRQENVEDRFRAYSTEGYDELMEAYQAMQASLDEQYRLNKQLIASRQSEMMFLNLSNLPFYPAFHYDRKKERMVENPWVYNIYTLLLELGALLPMIGGFFPVIKSLMEDNKKRMEEMDTEISDARDRLEELEKEQLELNTQYMEDQIELERLVMDSIIEKQQEEIDKLSLLNDAITDANAKLIETLNTNLEKIREQRENEKKEEELGEKERRLAYLRQDTSGANRQEIKKLEEELEDERRDYTDELIDQKISAIEEQNDKAAEQRQKQIDLLQSQLDHTQRYGLQWEEAQELIKNGFDSEGRLKVGTDLYNMLMAKEEITSLGMGSASEWQALKDWEITGVAAKVYQDINKVWERLIFGPLKSSGHDEDAQQKYNGDSLLKDIFDSFKNFIKTGFFSGDESTSISGKTLIPLFQEWFNKIKNNHAPTQAEGAGHIEETATQTGKNLGSSFIAKIGNTFSDIGNSITEGFKNLIEDKNTNTQTSTQTVGDINMEFHINSEDGESGMDIAESIVSAFKQGISNLSIFK